MSNQRYDLRGVSASKDDVHNAIKKIITFTKSKRRRLKKRYTKNSGICEECRIKPLFKLQTLQINRRCLKPEIGTP